MEYSKLDRIRDAYKEREQIKGKIVEFETMRTSPRAAVYGSERVQSSAKGDIQPDNIARLDDLIREYNTKLVECVELIFEFEEALKKLTEQERRIMRMYYIDCMTWEKICVETNISWTQMDRIKRRARKKNTGKERKF